MGNARERVTTNHTLFFSTDLTLQNNLKLLDSPSPIATIKIKIKNQQECGASSFSFTTFFMIVLLELIFCHAFHTG